MQRHLVITITFSEIQHKLSYLTHAKCLRVCSSDSTRMFHLANWNSFRSGCSFE